MFCNEQKYINESKSFSNESIERNYSLGSGISEFQNTFSNENSTYSSNESCSTSESDSRSIGSEGEVNHSVDERDDSFSYNSTSEDDISYKRSSRNKYRRSSDYSSENETIDSRLCQTSTLDSYDYTDPMESNTFSEDSFEYDLRKRKNRRRLKKYSSKVRSSYSSTSKKKRKKKKQTR